MSEYETITTTQRVREASRMDPYLFERWLAEIKRQVAANAWDMCCDRWANIHEAYKNNPFREES